MSNFVHSVIAGLAGLLTPFAGSLSVALAIVVVTVFVRALISPLTYVQVRFERRRAALAPRMAELPPADALTLLRSNGAGPLVSLLPGLAQAPFFMIMYRVALHPPAGVLFGVPLTAHLVAGLPVFAVLLALALALAHWSSRRLTAFRFLPYLTVAVVAWLPLAGALYLVTSTAWTALEHAVWRRPVTTGNR